MRSFTTYLLLLLACPAFSQNGLVKRASDYIKWDIGLHDPDAYISDAHELIPQELGAATGIPNMDLELMAAVNWIGQEVKIKDAFSAPSATHTTYSGNGIVNGMYFEIMTTLFSDSSTFDFSVRKQVVFVDFEEDHLRFEVRKYSFTDRDGTVLKYVLWKSIPNFDYQRLLLEDEKEKPPPRRMLIKGNSEEISFSTLEPSLWNITVFDNLGRVVHQIKSAGEGQQVVKLPPLPTGMYIAHLDVGSASYSERFMVLR